MAAKLKNLYFSDYEEEEPKTTKKNGLTNIG